MGKSRKGAFCGGVMRLNFMLAVLQLPFAFHATRVD